MRWFGKPKGSGLEGYESVGEADGAVLTALVGAGAALSEPRHVLHYLYVDDEQTAREAGAETKEAGWTVEVREPLPGRTEWLVLCRREGHILSPVAVLGDRGFFEALAARWSGEYDGWEASV